MPFGWEFPCLMCCEYKAEVTSDDEEKIYYGSCMGTFKERFGNHKKSFNLEKYREETKLSQYIWNLKDKNKQFEIAWSAVMKCRPYQSTSRRCDLCLSEKLSIVQGDSSKMINKRSEIANKCRHSNKHSYGRILTKRIEYLS